MNYESIKYTVTIMAVLDNSFLFFADIDISVFLLFIVVFLRVSRTCA